jgi:hypothetical protein
MKTLLTLSLFLSITVSGFAQVIPSKEIQIKTALMAAPEEKREGATVLGFDEKGNLVTLKKGSNDLICLADDPKSNGFNASCYHNTLEPFMARGRQLKDEGKSAKEIFDIREAEAKSGKLKMPKDGATLFVLSADQQNFDPKTGELKDSYLRYVVYIPWATEASTGLPLKPSGPAMPWIMDPGTHRAHIMINPPRK